MYLEVVCRMHTNQEDVTKSPSNCCVLLHGVCPQNQSHFGNDIKSRSRKHFTNTNLLSTVTHFVKFECRVQETRLQVNIIIILSP